MAVPNNIVFTPFSVLTAAQLNQMRANEDALAAGTAISAINTSVTAITNPYKFSAYKAANQTVNGTVKLLFDTEEFDTNNNFASSTYTVPVSGFYLFNFSMYIENNNVTVRSALYKNGSAHKYIGFNGNASNADSINNGSLLVSAAAGDTIEMYVIATSSRVIAGTTDVAPSASYFQGVLISRT